MSKPKTYVLVHGAWAAQYAWAKITPLLEQAGHKVVTLDLAGHGDDKTPVPSITMDTYIQQVKALVEAQAQPVVLVGHSMGGMVISGVAELVPQKIDKLVYLSAYLPTNGQDMQSISSVDTESAIGPNLAFAPDYSTATIKPDHLLEAFGGNASATDRQLIVAKHAPEPLAPFQGKAKLSDANFGKVPKFYIVTTQDKGLGTSNQRRMIAANGTIKQVFELASGHSPYLEKPEELAAILRQL